MHVPSSRPSDGRQRVIESIQVKSDSSQVKLGGASLQSIALGAAWTKNWRPGLQALTCGSARLPERAMSRPLHSHAPPLRTLPPSHSECPGGVVSMKGQQERCQSATKEATPSPSEIPNCTGPAKSRPSKNSNGRTAEGFPEDISLPRQILTLPPHGRNDSEHRGI